MICNDIFMKYESYPRVCLNNNNNNNNNYLYLSRITRLAVASFHRGPALKHIYNHIHYNDTININI